MAHITAIEHDGQHWVKITVNGQEVERRGPFATADEAETAAYQLAALCRTLFNGQWPVATADPPAGRRRTGSRRYG